LTSSVTIPTGEYLGMGYIKVAQAVPGQPLEAGAERIPATVLALAGAQPAALLNALDR
jgi:hypothetical protein